MKCGTLFRSVGVILPKYQAAAQVILYRAGCSTCRKMAAILPENQVETQAKILITMMTDDLLQSNSQKCFSIVQTAFQPERWKSDLQQSIDEKRISFCSSATSDSCYSLYF